MAKYTIECPKCGAVNTPPSSFKFWQKNMTCACCNHEFNISQSRLICKKCSNPECGKDIIFDQKKPHEKCPYCSTPLKNAATGEYKYEEVVCPQCSCIIDIDKNSKVAVCPICDKQIDVPALLATKKNANSTGISIIKYEGSNDIFVWKHPLEDFNIGSRLIVHESQEAIFLMGGQLVKTFTRGEYTLDTANLPMMKNSYNVSANGVNPFHAEVYFVNMTCQMGMKWGIDNPIGIMDPIYNVPVEIQAFGEMALQVSDSKKLLIKLVGTTSGVSWENEGGDFSKSLKQCFMPHLKPTIVSYITNIIAENKIDIFSVASQYEMMSGGLKVVVSPILEEFGLTANKFSIGNLTYNKNHESYQKISALRSNSLNVMKETAMGEVNIAREKAELSVMEVEMQKKRLVADTVAYQTVVAGNAQAQAALAKGQATAQIELAKGSAAAQVMAQQGYNKKDEFDAQAKLAFAESIGQISGNGGGIATEMMGLGLAMGVGGQMANQATQMLGNINAPNYQNSVWNCTCGRVNSGLICTVCGASKPTLWDCPNCAKKGITEKFCSGCGTQKPIAVDTWDCPNCGKKGTTDKFCSECGSQKPSHAFEWDCTNCGKKGIVDNFCSSCGTQKPTSAATWNCLSCGKAGLNGKFCSVCGAQKPN